MDCYRNGMERAGRKLAEVIPIHTREANALYLDLLKLAEAARRGEITGVAYTVLTSERCTREGVIGRSKKEIPLALTGAFRLAHALLEMAP